MYHPNGRQYTLVGLGTQQRRRRARMGATLRPYGNGDEQASQTRLETLNLLYFLNMAIRQNKTSGIDCLMQEMEAQAAEQQEAAVTTEHIEALKQLNGTLAESIVELKDAKYRVDDAREVCEDIYKRLWGICDGVHAALLRAENTRIKAHIDEKDIQRLTKFSDSILKAEEQLLNRHLEKQKELWHTSLARQCRNLESNEGIWC